MNKISGDETKENCINLKIISNKEWQIAYKKCFKIDKNNNIKNNYISRKIPISLFYFCTIYLFISISKIKCGKINYNDSSIHLKINGTEQIYIISVSYTGIEPTKIIKNGVETSFMKRINFEPSGLNINNVTLIWNSEISSSDNMFNRCYEIIEIDLSNFNTSKIIDIQRMFAECHSLQFINFNNFDTSSVTSMDSLFANCFSLTSLDLSNFDTSQVQKMSSMFEGCKELTSLDLSAFKTGNNSSIYRMFRGCNKLSFLDLSNFDTSKTTEFAQMFDNCDSLEFINLKNSIITKENIFTQLSQLPS